MRDSPDYLREHAECMSLRSATLPPFGLVLAGPNRRCGALARLETLDLRPAGWMRGPQILVGAPKSQSHPANSAGSMNPSFVIVVSSFSSRKQNYTEVALAAKEGERSL